MSHRRLVLVALGATSLLAAAAPAHAAPRWSRSSSTCGSRRPTRRTPRRWSSTSRSTGPTRTRSRSRSGSATTPTSSCAARTRHAPTAPPRRARTTRPLAPFRLEWAPGQQVARFVVALRGDTRRRGRREHQHPHLRRLAGIDIGDNDIDIVLRRQRPARDDQPVRAAARPVPERAAVRARRRLHALPRLAAPGASRAATRDRVVVRDYTLTHGSATPGVDYVTFAPFRLYFPAGSNSARFPVGSAATRL